MYHQVNKLIIAMVISMESVSALKKELDEREVINSGTGVENEEREKDASTASDPIEANGPSAADDVVEHCEPVHTSTRKASRRRRKVTIPNDSAPKRRKKITKVGFDGRCNQPAPSIQKGVWKLQCFCKLFR